MAMEVAETAMGEIKSQHKDIRTIEKRFLSEVRDNYIAWGCNKKCVEFFTQNYLYLGWGMMGECQCPAEITIKGDTSIFMH